jgi:hypothetical protein
MILNFHTFESCRTPVDWEFLREMTLPTRFVFRALTVVHGVYMLQNLGLPQLGRGISCAGATLCQ